MHIARRTQDSLIVRGIAVLLAAGALAYSPRSGAPLPLFSVTAVAAGGDHTCALALGGGVYCWGSNFAGELGDGTTVAKAGAVNVSGLTSGITAITAGTYHSCALTSTGGVLCWGSNASGQLGTGNTVDQPTPVGVLGLSSGVASISAGYAHTCAVMTSRALKCWGTNNEAQLGDGTIVGQMSPIDVPGLSTGVAKVSASVEQTCIVMVAGGVKCWGNGGLVSPFNPGPPRLTPTDIAVSGPAIDVAAGAQHACAVLANKTVQCWGHGAMGQLGNNARLDRADPVDIAQAALTVQVNGVQISAGLNHTCVIEDFQGVVCWGGNHIGQVGANEEFFAQSYPIGVGVSIPFFTPGRLGVIATRGTVNGPHGGQLIAGFAVGGVSGPADWGPGKTVVIRARGPSLASSGVAGALANPTLQLQSASGALAFNDDYWSSADADTIRRWGYEPPDPHESVIVAQLPPGLYTAIVGSADGTAGQAIIEVFEIDMEYIMPITNLSSRSEVVTGDGVMIGGFIIDGVTPRKVAITATGPSLAAYGVSSPLSHPSLTIVRAGVGIVATNVGWQNASNAADLQTSGFAPGSPQDSGLLLTLDPGAYTAIVSGADGGTGDAVLGIFQAP